MANRHLSRSIALQTLFEWDFQHSQTKLSIEIPHAVERNAEEFAPGIGDLSFAESLVSGVIENQEAIDDVIEKAAPDWPIEKIAMVDRNTLRVGLFELLYADRNEVPPKVAINEAIELAKTFGGENSGKFVNGVLGAVYKELGEPGKDDQGTKKKKETDPKKFPIERLGGAVVYAKNGEDVYLALVHDIFGHWTLTKGHLEDGDEEAEGTKKKIKEELGIEVVISDQLGTNEYIASNPEKGKIRKKVVYFLAKSKFEDLKLKESGGLDDAKWFRLKDIIDLNIYDDILPIVTKAINILLSKKD